MANQSLNFNKAEFIFGAAHYEDLPKTSLPEVAFWGRSNCGKSSIINAVTRRAKLVRTSNSPGATKQINLFSIDDKVMLVDMPGYGYAKAAKTEIIRWQELVTSYILHRTNLKLIFILIDIRRRIMPIDREVIEQLNRHGVLFNIIATKCDKINLIEAIVAVAEIHDICGRYGNFAGYTIQSSSSKLVGIDEIQAVISEIYLRSV